jgi:hypothetical protein
MEPVRFNLCGASNKKMFVVAFFSITLFLLLSFCKSKGDQPTSQANIGCPDSVFNDLKLADQNKSCVKTLDLVEKGLKTFPLNIVNYPNLIRFDLSMNYIETIPDEIWKLTKLRSLIMAYGIVKYLPASIGNLKNLKNLELMDNHLETIPETIGDLSSLERLNLCRNNITTLPKSIIRLKKLQFLCVSDPEGVCRLSAQEKAFILANLPNCRTNFGPQE